MHPHSVSRNGSFGTHAEVQRRSSLTSGSLTSGSHHPLASDKPRYTLVSPRPQTARVAPSSRLKTGKDNRPNTPLTHRTSKSGITTPHRGSLGSTPARRSGTGSVHEHTSLPAAATTARIRRRSTSLTGSQHKRTPVRKGETPKRKVASVQSVGLPSSYEAPPTPTARPLGLKPLSGPAAKRTRQHLTPKRTEGDEENWEVNEPFAEASALQRRTSVESGASPSPSTLLMAQARSTYTSGEVVPLAHPTDAERSALCTSPRVNTPKSSRKRPPALLQLKNKSRSAPHKRVAASSACGDPHSAAEGPLTAFPPDGAFQMPQCDDADLRRLYLALLCYNPADVVWSLHRHVVPFLAAHASAIMSVSAEQMLAFLGDVDATAHLAPAHKKSGDSAVLDEPSAKSVARFASELCSWLFYVALLGCGEGLTWGLALGISGYTSAGAIVHGEERQSVSRGAGTPKRQATACGESSFSLAPSARHSPTSLPHVLQPHSSSEGAGKGEAEDTDKNGSVLWHTTARIEHSMFAASSTFASLDFRTVVEVPPFVTTDAFVRGYGVLRRLLADRPTMANSTDKEGSRNGEGTVLLRTALRAGGAEAQVKKSFARREHQPQSSHASPAVRASLRRVQFYLRFHNFLRQLSLWQHATKESPCLRDAQLIESVLCSRLFMSAKSNGTAAPLPKKRAAGMEVGDVVPRTSGWLASYLYHRSLHNAILRCMPLATHNGTAVDTLDILLTLRNREAERIVCSTTGADDGTSTSQSLEKHGGEHVNGGAIATKKTHRPVPASLFLLFPLPRWTPWRSTGMHVATPSTGGAIMFGWCAYLIALLLTLSFGPALYYVLRCIEPDWMPWWDAADIAIADRNYAAVVLSVDLSVLSHALCQLALFVPVVLLTSYLGHRRGAFASKLEIQRRLVESQAARLTTAASTWLYSAWALQKENTVAAAAAQSCLSRLALACRATEATVAYRSVPTSRLFVAVVCVFSVLFCALQVALFPHQSFVNSLGLSLVLLFAWRSVSRGWQHSQRVLDWWLQQQTSLAEGFAIDLLHEVAASGGWVMTCVDVDGESRLQPAVSSFDPVTPYVFPLPILEELTRIAYIIHLCEHAGCDRSPKTPGANTQLPSVCAVQYLSDFPVHSFWEQLCGHTAVAYAGDISAIAVVERVAAGCAHAAEEALVEHTEGLQASVQRLIRCVVPWAGRAALHQPPNTKTGEEEEEDEHLCEVMAPVAAAMTRSHDDAHFPGNLSSPQSPGGVVHGSAESSIPVDVQLRCVPYLTLTQRRLLVCAAVVFAALAMPPPSDASAGRGEVGTRIAERTLVCLIELVLGQLKDAVVAAVTPRQRWREAARRTREALQLAEHAAISMRLQGGLDSASCEKGRHSILPQLHHVLFAYA